MIRRYGTDSFFFDRKIVNINNEDPTKDRIPAMMEFIIRKVRKVPSSSAMIIEDIKGCLCDRVKSSFDLHIAWISIIAYYVKLPLCLVDGDRTIEALKTEL